MQFLISFLEGIITFVSPCLLPMLPVYVSYFAGGKADEHTRKKTLFNALGFVAGFTIVFLCLGAFAGTLGFLLKRYSFAINLITGFIVVIFGLNYLGVFKLKILNMHYGKEADLKTPGFFSSALFGMIFSIGWTPCVGAFLGSALMLASQQGSVGSGILMLLCYSLGLGIPFIVSAVLIDRLKNAFRFIKSHYKIINLVSGSLLVVLGLLMMTGLMGRFLALLTF